MPTSPRERLAQVLRDAAPAKPLSLDTLDDAALPPVHAPAQEITIIEPVAEFGNARDQLQSVVTKAIRFLEDVLDMQDSLDTEAVRLLSIKLQAAQTAINTQAKVDDTQLRARQIDQLPKLLALIAREEGKLLELEVN